MERRGFLAAIGGIVSGVPEVKALEAKPGSVFVLEVNDRLSQQATEQIRNAWRSCWDPAPAPKLILLDNGTTLKVVEKEPT